MRLYPRRLRIRLMVGLAALGLGLSVVLGVSTYQLARWYLLGQREALAVQQSTLHARAVSGKILELGQPTADEYLEMLALTKSRAVILAGSDWFSATLDVDRSRIPPALIDEVRSGTSMSQRLRINEAPHFVVGVPMLDGEAAYFEFVPAVEYERTLRTLAVVLVSVGSATTALAAALGWAISRRVLRPLEAVAESASAMSNGDLERRLDVGSDPDLLPVAEAFNEMAASLSERIAREQRFTADVSHELRTPLTAMSSAVALVRRSLSLERAQFAVDVIADQIDHLTRLTTDLLELAVVDAAKPSSAAELVDVSALILGQAEMLGMASAVDPRCKAQLLHRVNPLRLQRIVVNLLENAQRYGGGATRIHWSRSGPWVRVEVDDAGPGVPDEERQAIFGRFHRGSASNGAPHVKGTGLGLALVEEYAHLEGGSVWVEDAPGTGARFVVELRGTPS